MSCAEGLLDIKDEEGNCLTDDELKVHKMLGSNLVRPPDRPPGLLSLQLFNQSDLRTCCNIELPNIGRAQECV